MEDGELDINCENGKPVTIGCEKESFNLTFLLLSITPYAD